jgi:cell division protein FtsN
MVEPDAVPASVSTALASHSADPAGMDAPPRMTHSVQVGAYRHLVNAEQQIARLTAKGYPARLFETKDSGYQTWYTVRIGDYPTAESARTIADEFSRREKMETFVCPIGKL